MSVTCYVSIMSINKINNYIYIYRERAMIYIYIYHLQLLNQLLSASFVYTHTCTNATVTVWLIVLFGAPDFIVYHFMWWWIFFTTLLFYLGKNADGYCFQVLPKGNTIFHILYVCVRVVNTENEIYRMNY